MPSGIYERKPLSEEHKRNIGKALKGRKRPAVSNYMKGNTYAEGHTPWNKG